MRPPRRGAWRGHLEAPLRVSHLGKLGETSFPEFPPKGGRGETFPQEFPYPGCVEKRGGMFSSLGDASPWNIVCFSNKRP